MVFGKFRTRIFYGWVIVIATNIININLMGTRFSFGVFFKSLAVEFDLTRAVTSSLISAYLILCAVISILGGWAMDKYGARPIFFITGLFSGLSLLLTSQTNSLWQLYLSYSLLLAIGTGAIYTLTLSTISKWFDKQCGLAMGISGAGVGIGQMLFAPFAAMLISNFGWRMSYIVMGSLIGFMAICMAALIQNDPSDINVLPDGIQAKDTAPDIISRERNCQTVGLSLSQALKSKNFWIFMPTWVFMGFGNFLVLTHIVPYATDAGLPAVNAATIISVVGVLNILSGIVVGRICDILGSKIPGIFLSLIRALAVTGLIWADQLWMFYIFAVVFGITHGGSSPVLASLCVDIFGRHSLGVIMGTLAAIFSISAAIGPFVGGLIFDLKGSYSLAFLITAVTSVLMSVSIASVGVKKWRESNL